ncbi:MAG: cupin domain-containing protein [Bacteroidota bacterium]|nr:cupin domain-containing protein [Bacteroidota bacterium]
MKNIFLLLFTIGLYLVSSLSNSAQAQEAGTAAKNIYKLLADTLGVKMYEIVFKPGDVAPFHTHPDHCIYVLEGGKLEVTDVSGTKIILDGKPGMAMIGGPESHSAVNIGKTKFRAIVVEVYRPRK